MSHEITRTDGLVLTGTPAWHGLGTVVEQAPTPYQALHLAGIDWNVVPASLSATTFTTDENGVESPLRVQVPDRVALMRDDTNEVLGIVSDRYEIVQNRELADVIYEVAEDLDVTVESAGSLKGGQRVFFLVHLDSLGLNHGDDVIKQYAMFRTGHDGKTEVSVRQTNVRVVCANTERMAIATDRGAGFRHRGDVMSNVRHMKAALGHISKQAEQFKVFAEKALVTKMNASQINEYIDEVYEEANGKIADENKNPRAFARYENTTREIRSLLHHTWNAPYYGTAWGAYNAVTQYATHSAPTRRTGGMSAYDARLVSTLDGKGDTYSRAAHKVLAATMS